MHITILLLFSYLNIENPLNKHHRAVALAICSMTATLLSGCATSGNADAQSGYHPNIIWQGVDPAVYEKDRAACESTTRQNATNYSPTNTIAFRRCLVQRGYRLMSEAAPTQPVHA